MTELQHLRTTNDPEDVFGYIQRQQAAHLETLRAIAKHTQRIAPTTTSYEVDLAYVALKGPNLFPEGVMLPGEGAIAFAFIENHGASASLSVFAGSNGGGRLLQTVSKGTFKVFPVPDDIKSLSIVASGTDGGAVRVVVTSSRDWAPQMGALV